VTFWQRLKERMREGFEPTYLVRNPDKPAPVRGLKKRGVGWTRKDRSTSKARRLMTKAKSARGIDQRKRRGGDTDAEAPEAQQ